MSLLRLVRRNLWRHPIRTGLTFTFAALALFLFVFLRSVVTTLDSAVRAAASDRIVVQSAVSLFVYLPESYRGKIEAVEGVESTSPWVWFGGYYQKPENFFAQFACDLETHLRQYPELSIDPEQAKDLLRDKDGCLVGFEEAEKFGWKVGDKVPIVSNIYGIEKDKAFEFTVRAIYRSSRANVDNKTMFFHYDYLKEFRKKLRERGFDTGDQQVGIYMTKVKPGYSADRVIEAIDHLFDPGPQRTATQTEAQFQAQFTSMLGNIPTLVGWIGGAVLFAILVSIANTASMAGRERARDVGIMKALGFRDVLAAGMLLVESMAVVGAGGILGAVLGATTEAMFRSQFALFIPNYHVESRTVVAGAVVGVVIGFLGGIVPALRLSRLRTVDVLRQEA